MNIKKEICSSERFKLFLFIVFYVIVLFIWAYKQPLDSSPDEGMRYAIPQYIYEHHTLPTAYDTEILDANYGISYATRPVLSSMISAILMSIISIFTTEDIFLLMAARCASILCGIGFCIYVYKIAKVTFTKKNAQWLFLFLTCLWPQCAFMFTYVNSDSLALFSIAMIIYYWLQGMANKWQTSSCIKLAISLAVAMLSYYNLYGYILCSAILFFQYYKHLDFSLNKYKKMLTKGFLIIGIVFVLAGWFFIRNAILYNGDFLGNRVTIEIGNQYGIPGYRPLDRAANSIALLKTFPGVIRWFLLTGRSFIGCFGYMTIPLFSWMYMIYIIECLIGIGIILLSKRNTTKKEVSKIPQLLSLQLLFTSIITLLLSLYYSFSDYQPQGRYILPILLPFTLLIVKGFEKQQNKIVSLLICVINSILFLLFPLLLV